MALDDERKDTMKDDSKKLLEKKVRVGCDKNGKAKYKSVYGRSKKELDKKIKKLETEVCDLPYYYESYDTFKSWGERWYKHIRIHGNKGRKVGPSQLRSYGGYPKHFYEAIGEIPINEITRNDIQNVIDNLYVRNPNTGKPAAKKTLQDIKGTASKVFEYAIDCEVINKNPAKKVDIPADADVKERRALTPDEIKMIENTPNRRGIDKEGNAADEFGMQVPAMIMLYAGLRRGEVIPLLWSDVDLNAGTINVNKAVDVSSNLPVIKPPKTKAGYRKVFIHPILVKYLKYLKKIRGKKSELVCPSLDGDMYTATSWRVGWNCYMQDLDIKYGSNKKRKSKYDRFRTEKTIDIFTPHCLRHTFGSMLNAAGVNIKTIQTQMGHADIRTTMNRYVHDNEEHCSNEMKKFFGTAG